MQQSNNSPIPSGLLRQWGKSCVHMAATPRWERGGCLVNKDLGEAVSGDTSSSPRSHGIGLFGCIQWMSCRSALEAVSRDSHAPNRRQSERYFFGVDELLKGVLSRGMGAGWRWKTCQVGRGVVVGMHGRGHSGSPRVGVMSARRGCFCSKRASSL